MGIISDARSEAERLRRLQERAQSDALSRWENKYQSEKDPFLKEQYRLRLEYQRARNAGDWTRAAAIQDKQRQHQDFKATLSIYDEEAGKFADKVRRGFRTSAEVTAANQMRGVERNVEQTMARRGIEGGMEGVGHDYAQTTLGAQTAQSISDFESQLNQAMRSEREGFVRGEFDYIHRLNTMRYQTDLNKELAEYQAQLQRDLESSRSFGNMLKLGGSVVGSIVGGR